MARKKREERGGEPARRAYEKARKTREQRKNPKEQQNLLCAMRTFVSFVALMLLIVSSFLFLGALALFFLPYVPSFFFALVLFCFFFCPCFFVPSSSALALCTLYKPFSFAPFFVLLYSRFLEASFGGVF